MYPHPLPHVFRAVSNITGDVNNRGFSHMIKDARVMSIRPVSVILDHLEKSKLSCVFNPVVHCVSPSC